MAARTLGKIGGDEAFTLLEQALHDPDPVVRTAAAGSILRALKIGIDREEEK